MYGNAKVKTRETQVRRRAETEGPPRQAIYFPLFVANLETEAFTTSPIIGGNNAVSARRARLAPICSINSVVLR